MSNEQLIAEAELALTDNQLDVSLYAGGSKYVNGKKLVSRLTTALKEAEEKQGWQPIDTAPRDATEIIVYGKDASGDGFTHVVRYGAPHWYIGKRSMTFVGDDLPTHWMPLPLPPTIEQ